MEGRAAVVPYLLHRIAERGHLPDAALMQAIRDDFPTGAMGEDQFDAVIGLLGMLDVVAEHRAEGPSLEAVLPWEGWILGQSG